MAKRPELQNSLSARLPVKPAVQVLALSCLVLVWLSSIAAFSFTGHWHCLLSEAIPS